MIGLNTRANALYIIPIFFVLNMIGQVLLGGIFFLDFENLSIVHILMLFVGLLFTVSGTYVLSRHETTSDPLANIEDAIEKKIRHNIQHTARNIQNKARITEHTVRRPKPSNIKESIRKQ